MPTGYTAAIKDGIAFEQYVMICARAFGALIMMRDEPYSTPIPERFEPSDYNAKRLKESQESLAWYQNMADSEAEREAAKDHANAVERYKKIMTDANELRNKYSTILAQCVQWQPPTPAIRFSVWNQCDEK